MNQRSSSSDLEAAWVANAAAWTRVVREERIESRRVATGAAIVEAVRQRAPRRALDVGCGEGWLARALAEGGIDVVGVDGSAPLIDAARAAGGGAFHVRSYAEIVADPEALGADFDAVIFNFALLEKDVGLVLRAVRRCIAPSGALCIQTVHPWAARGDAPYRDAWRTETFSGFDLPFPASMPWFYRTLESWVSLLHDSGYRIVSVREPRHPETSDPLSLLFICAPA
ncbi:MAG TPA: class I SAM-dependent methyltransferase [Longimicrobium sp.]|nr:class I SAM-dependent methyltransferase [Longimicrobium sp.]